MRFDELLSEGSIYKTEEVRTNDRHFKQEGFQILFRGMSSFRDLFFGDCAVNEAGAEFGEAGILESMKKPRSLSPHGMIGRC